MGKGRKMRTAGVVAVKPGDAMTGEEPCVLFVQLRWTRSGFKSLMHVLNSSDSPRVARRAAENCTDDELGFFLGTGGRGDGVISSSPSEAQPGDGDGAHAECVRQVERLWHHPLVPSSWTREKGPEALAAAPGVYAVLAGTVRRERTRRAEGGGCRRDALSRASLQLPKGAVDPGETPWMAAVRELREEAGVEASEVQRAETAPGIRAGPMTAFVVTLGEDRTRAGWEVEGSPETVAARWVPVSEVAPGPECRMEHVRQVREVLAQVVPHLSEYVPPQGTWDGDEGNIHRTREGKDEGAKRSRFV